MDPPRHPDAGDDALPRNRIRVCSVGSLATQGRKDMSLSERQEQMCTESRWDFSDLGAVFLNCTLKRSPEQSHTEGLIEISRSEPGTSPLGPTCQND
jgi:hypothetical protein